MSAMTGAHKFLERVFPDAFLPPQCRRVAAQRGRADINFSATYKIFLAELSTVKSMPAEEGRRQSRRPAPQIRLVAIRIVGCVKRLVRLDLGFLISRRLDGFLTILDCVFKILHCRLARLLGLIALGVTPRRFLSGT